MKLDFSNLRILVIGDFMIDHYIMGSSNRISPEAPVPVVIPNDEFSIPGGAGNVAMNLQSLGSNVYCDGIVGEDKWGKKLIKIFEKNNINCDRIVSLKNHPTTVKKRIYSNKKQVARLDIEKVIDWDYKNDILSASDKYDAIILSDYNKGVLSNSKDIINHIKSINPDNIIIVDPKKNDFDQYDGSNIVTPNLLELGRATNCSIKDEKSVLNACYQILDKYNFEYVCAKKGKDGMTIVGKNGYKKDIKPHFVENPDVTGAGDTAISSLALTYAQTKDIEFSATVANAAASIAVSKTGTAMVHIEELNQLISSKID